MRKLSVYEDSKLVDAGPESMKEEGAVNRRGREEADRRVSGGAVGDGALLKATI